MSYDDMGWVAVAGACGLIWGVQKQWQTVCGDGCLFVCLVCVCAVCCASVL